MNPIELIGGLRLILISCPFKEWENPLVRALFSKMLLLRFQGYETEYSKKVLAVEKYDFVADHFLVGRGGIDEDFEILYAMKMVNTISCREFELVFPAADPVPLLEKDEFQIQIDALIKQYGEFSYTGSRVAAPSIQHKRGWARVLGGITMAIHELYILETGLSGDFCVTVNSLDPRIIIDSGHRLVMEKSFMMQSLGGADCKMYVRTGETTPWSKQMIEQFGKIWEERVQFGTLVNQNNKKKAA